MRIRIKVLLCLYAAFLPLAFSQCTAPILETTPRGSILTPTLEYELGEIDAEQQAVSVHLLEVDALKGHLQEIGQRIERHLPPNEIKFRYYIVDEGSANAWALPGGRIYVTRKLISYAHSEDELAAVIAHEMGHQLAHHGAVRWSKIVKDALGVSSIKDRAELEDVMNRYMDVYRRKGPSGDDGDREQGQADQVAVFAMAAAGYDPKAAVEFWNRFADLKGKKGNWFLDVFGSTSSDSKRLRSFANVAGNLPGNCVDRKLPVDASGFTRWQAAVRTYSGPGQKELVKGVVFKRQLLPPLRSEISQLKFSPDGKYILAQDEASIFVLTREPFAVVMRIDAENAYPAQFAGDSRHVSFYTDSLRVERWSVETKEMEDVGEVHAVHGCIQTELSPDGKYLACLEPGPDFLPLQLAVFDVGTNDVVFKKTSYLGSANSDDQLGQLIFIIIRSMQTDFSSLGISINMSFSPDSKYFIAGKGNNPLGVDLVTRKEIPLPASIKKFLGKSFAFLGPDRLIGVDGERGEKSGVVKFPSGETIMSDLPIGPLWLSSPGHGDYVIARPLPKSPVGIMDLKQKQFTVGSRTDALDIYDGVYISERVSGELALYIMANPTPVATLQLPPAPIGTVHAFSLSPDLKYLALSERKRGSIWDIETGNRMMFVRGFRGVTFNGNSVLMDFPSQDDYIPPLMQKQRFREAERVRNEQPGHSIVIFGVNGGQPQERDKFLKKDHVRMNGNYVLVMNADEPEKDWNKNVSLEVRDARTGAKLWSKRFDKQVPSLNYRPDSEYLLMTWNLSDSAVKQEIQNDKEAKQRLDNLHEEFEGSYFIEVVELRTGNVVGRFPVDTGKRSFGLSSACVFGNRVFLNDTFDRVLVYSLQGKLLGRYFGTLRAVSNDGNYVALNVGRGDLKIYSVPGKQLLDELVFESRVSHVEFAADGKKLVVLTRDQTLYQVNLQPLLAAKN